MVFLVMARSKRTSLQPWFLVARSQHGKIICWEWMSRSKLANLVNESDVYTGVQVEPECWLLTTMLHTIERNVPRTNRNGLVSDNLGCLPILDPYRDGPERLFLSWRPPKLVRRKMLRPEPSDM